MFTRLTASTYLRDLVLSALTNCFSQEGGMWALTTLTIDFDYVAYLSFTVRYSQPTCFTNQNNYTS
jgi:hypothetical protein